MTDARTLDLSDVAPRMRLAFEVNDVQGATAAVVAGGARLVAGPVKTPWRSLNARFDAPGDLHLTVFEELDGPHRRRGEPTRDHHKE